MKKSATEPSWQGGMSPGDHGAEGPRERLRRSFLRELPAQLDQVTDHWEHAMEGDVSEHASARRLLHRLARESILLQLPGHFLLLEALEECVASLEKGTALPERVGVAVNAAVQAVGQLGSGDMARAEREAAQLRWMTQDSEAMSSGVFPRKFRK